MKINKTKILKLFIVFLICLTLFYAVKAETYTPAKLRTMIEDLDFVVDELSDAGLGTQRIEDIIDEANIAHQAQRFDDIPAMIDEAYYLRDKALSLKQDIEELDRKISMAEEESIDVSSVELVFSELEIEMKLENYDQCEILLEQAENLLSESVREQYISYAQEITPLRELATDVGLDTDAIEDISLRFNNQINVGDVEKIIQIIDELELVRDSIVSINSITDIIAESQSTGIKTLRFEDMLAEAEYHFSRSDFEEVISLGDETVALYDSALQSRQRIADINDKLYSIKNSNLDVDFANSERLFEAGKAEYELENYVDSEQLLKQSMAELEQAEADALLFGAINTNYAKERFVNFMKNYWWLLLIVIVALIFAGNKAYSKIQEEYITRKIESMEKELVFIDKAIKKSQDEYFNKKIISKGEYNTIVDEHQERMLIIREKLPILKAKLNKR